MERFERVEALQQKAGVSFQDARQALEQNDWDMLNAFIQLEKEGKLSGNQAQTGSTDQAKQPKKDPANHQTAQKVEGWLNRAIDWIKSMIEKGNNNYFVISKDGKKVLDISVTVTVLLLLLLNGLIPLILILGLILGYRASYRSDKEIAADRKIVREAEEAAQEINNHHTVNSI